MFISRRRRTGNFATGRIDSSIVDGSIAFSLGTIDSNNNCTFECDIDTDIKIGDQICCQEFMGIVDGGPEIWGYYEYFRGIVTRIEDIAVTTKETNFNGVKRITARNQIEHLLENQTITRRIENKNISEIIQILEDETSLTLTGKYVPNNTRARAIFSANFQSVTLLQLLTRVARELDLAISTAFYPQNNEDPPSGGELSYLIVEAIQSPSSSTLVSSFVPSSFSQVTSEKSGVNFVTLEIQNYVDQKITFLDSNLGEVSEIRDEDNDLNGLSWAPRLLEPRLTRRRFDDDDTRVDIPLRDVSETQAIFVSRIRPNDVNDHKPYHVFGRKISSAILEFDFRSSPSDVKKEKRIQTDDVNTYEEAQRYAQSIFNRENEQVVTTTFAREYEYQQRTINRNIPNPPRRSVERNPFGFSLSTIQYLIGKRMTWSDVTLVPFDSVIRRVDVAPLGKIDEDFDTPWGLTIPTPMRQTITAQNVSFSSNREFIRDVARKLNYAPQGQAKVGIHETINLNFELESRILYEQPSETGSAPSSNLTELTYTSLPIDKTASRDLFFRIIGGRVFFQVNPSIYPENQFGQNLRLFFDAFFTNDETSDNPTPIGSTATRSLANTGNYEFLEFRIEEPPVNLQKALCVRVWDVDGSQAYHVARYRLFSNQARNSSTTTQTAPDLFVRLDHTGDTGYMGMFRNIFFAQERERRSNDNLLSGFEYDINHLLIDGKYVPIIHSFQDSATELVLVFRLDLVNIFQTLSDTFTFTPVMGRKFDGDDDGAGVPLTHHQRTVTVPLSNYSCVDIYLHMVVTA